MLTLLRVRRVGHLQRRQETRRRVPPASKSGLLAAFIASRRSRARPIVPPPSAKRFSWAHDGGRGRLRSGAAAEAGLSSAVRDFKGGESRFWIYRRVTTLARLIEVASIRLGRGLHRVRHDAVGAKCDQVSAHSVTPICTQGFLFLRPMRAASCAGYSIPATSSYSVLSDQRE